MLLKTVQLSIFSSAGSNCVKNILMGIFFWVVFYRFRTEYGKIREKSLCPWRRQSSFLIKGSWWSTLLRINNKRLVNEVDQFSNKNFNLCIFADCHTVWKVSKYGVFSGPYLEWIRWYIKPKCESHVIMWYLLYPYFSYSTTVQIDVCCSSNYVSYDSITTNGDSMEPSTK